MGIELRTDYLIYLFFCAVKLTNTKKINFVEFLVKKNARKKSKSHEKKKSKTKNKLLQKITYQENNKNIWYSSCTIKVLRRTTKVC